MKPLYYECHITLDPVDFGEMKPSTYLIDQLTVITNALKAKGSLIERPDIDAAIVTAVGKTLDKLEQDFQEQLKKLFS